jgi:hypothetical protein
MDVTDMGMGMFFPQYLRNWGCVLMREKVHDYHHHSDYHGYFRSGYKFASNLVLSPPYHLTFQATYLATHI